MFLYYIFIKINNKILNLIIILFNIIILYIINLNLFDVEL